MSSIPSAVGLLVIGDEILSGKRHDRHFPKLIELLAARGMSLAWAQFLGDEEAAIAEALTAALRRGDVVLSCGGIGATPDDRTRQAAALAFGCPIARHPQALALIEAQYGERAHPHRVLMADFPRGADLIPNPVNRVAGFSMQDRCFFVPGFPEMAWPMLEWVLDERLRHLHRADPPVEYRLRANGSAREGDLLPLMDAVLERYAGVKLSSLPFRGDGQRAAHIEFGIRGPRVLAGPAFLWFREQLAARDDVAVEDLQAPEPLADRSQ